MILARSPEMCVYDDDCPEDVDGHMPFRHSLTYYCAECSKEVIYIREHDRWFAKRPFIIQEQPW